MATDYSTRIVNRLSRSFLPGQDAQSVDLMAKITSSLYVRPPSQSESIPVQRELRDSPPAPSSMAASRAAISPSAAFSGPSKSPRGPRPSPSRQNTINDQPLTPSAHDADSLFDQEFAGMSILEPEDQSRQLVTPPPFARPGRTTSTSSSGSSHQHAPAPDPWTAQPAITAKENPINLESNPIEHIQYTPSTQATIKISQRQNSREINNEEEEEYDAVVDGSDLTKSSLEAAKVTSDENNTDHVRKVLEGLLTNKSKRPREPSWTSSMDSLPPPPFSSAKPVAIPVPIKSAAPPLPTPIVSSFDSALAESTTWEKVEGIRDEWQELRNPHEDVLAISESESDEEQEDDEEEEDEEAEADYEASRKVNNFGTDSELAGNAGFLPSVERRRRAQGVVAGGGDPDGMITPKGKRTPKTSLMQRPGTIPVGPQRGGILDRPTPPPAVVSVPQAKLTPEQKRLVAELQKAREARGVPIHYQPRHPLATSDW